MARGISKLSGADLRRSKPGTYGDGGGLWLQVSAARDGKRRNRSWVFRYTTNCRTREMGLGSLDTLSLAEARERARKCRQLRLDGIDPIEYRNAERAAKAAESAKSITFEAAAHAYIASHRETWRNEKHAQQWPSSLRKHIFPVFGSLPVSQIDTPLILKALQPLWSRVPETASRLRGRIESILDWATVSGFRQGDNPARWDGHLKHLLAAPSKRRVNHLAAMTWADVPAFMQKLRATDGVPARALEFSILAAARRNEALGAVWSEIDFDSAVWTIPGERMKSAREHRVPLSRRALQILQEARATAHGDHVFTRAGGNRPLANSSLVRLLQQLGHGDVTAHGFRASFSTWVAERSAFNWDALAHAVKGVAGDYQRGDLLTKRRRLMEAWSAFCAKPMVVGATVTPLRAGR